MSELIYMMCLAAQKIVIRREVKMHNGKKFAHEGIASAISPMRKNLFGMLNECLIVGFGIILDTDFAA